jgi:2-desacetyl-2-hydroxyethyl bacteriochlorophyllide A dehydrogenase
VPTLLTVPAPREIRLESVPSDPPGPGQVRIETLYSGISAGTELATYRGSNPYLHKRWDAEQRLFQASDVPSLAYPVRNMGYEEVGRVVELGPGVVVPAVGDLVYGTWGHRSEAVVDAAWAAVRRLPDGLDPLLGIFSHIGSVALNGVHDAAIRIGDTVAVFGLGVPGQIVAQLAKRSGATVIGVDPLGDRRRLASELGAVDVALDPAGGGAAEAIKARTDGRGADVTIEVSGMAAALHEAIRATAYSARVVALGFFQGAPTGLALGDEFHHNRVSLISSQISGVAPEQSYRWDKPRLARTVMALQADGTLNLRPLVSHVLPFAEAAAAFAMLDASPESALQVVLATEAAPATGPAAAAGGAA